MNVDTFNALTFTLIGVGLLTIAYVGGRLRQQVIDQRLGLIPAPYTADEVEPYAMVAEREVLPLEVSTVTAAMEVVSYLDPVTGPIALVPAIEAPAAPRFGQLALDAPLEDVKLLAAQAEVARLRELVQKKDRLRARYLRLLRGERARLRYMLGDVMDAPRRPRKLQLVTVKLDMPHHRKLALVTPLKAREWRAELAMAS